MSRAKRVIKMPDPFIFVTESPHLDPVGSPPVARRRECPTCRHSQVVTFGHSVPRETHWCERSAGRHFVVWDPQ